MSQQDRIGRFSATQAVLVLIGVTLVLRILGAIWVGWGTGEAYYLASARQFHLSYYDQPPLFLWMIWGIVTATGSDAILLIRLPFILMFAGSTWLAFDIVRRIHSARGGFFAALIINACILFSLSIGSWAQPDAPMLLFWMATVRVLIEILFGEGRARPYFYWSLAGVLLGLTFLSKYHAIFIVLGAGLYMLADPAQRHWFLHRAPWLALVIALAIFSPVIIWNAQNEWASFGFQGGRALAEQNLRWDGLIRMIIGQLVYMVPWLALPALYIGLRALLAGPKRSYISGIRPGVEALFAYIAWPPILFFTVVALWSDTQFHFHWQAPGYIMLFMLMGAWAANRNGRGVRAWLWGSAAITFVILALLISHCATGWWRNAFPGEWEDPTYSQLPWTEVGTTLDATGVFTGEREFVMGTNWIDCGYVDTQVAGRVPLACIGADTRNLAYNFDPAAHAGWNAYVVVRTGNIGGVIRELDDRFEQIEHVETLDIMRNGYPELRDIQVYRATGFKP